MENYLYRVWERLKEGWSKLNINQKVLVAAGLILTVIALTMGIKAVTQPELTPLFPKLETQDAAAVVAKLKELKIPYQIGEDGTTILVAPKDKYATRLQLANEGLPKGTIGFESLNENRFGETTHDKEVRYLVALQGELTRTIESLAEVEKARVHLSLPKDSLFTAEKPKRTASVMIKLKPGASLNERQVRGLVHFVASSVENLKPENVTIIDVNGNILSEDVTATEPVSASKLTANQIEIQKQVENQLEKSLQSMLERVVGFGKVVVRVSAKLDFNQVESVSEVWGNKVERSIEEIETRSTGQTVPAQGPVGTSSNIQTYPTPQPQGSQSENQNTQTRRNYEIDRTETRTKVAPGTVKDLSVAVIYDGDDNLKTMIAQTVAKAAGITEDRVSVTAMPFNTAYWDKLQADMEKEVRMEQLKRMAVVGGAVLAALMVGGIMMFLWRRRQRREQFDQVVGEEITVEDLLAEQLELTSEEQKERAMLKGQLEKLIREKPEEVAQLVKSWLVEDTR
ncbi:MAG: flagellar M-ring protein FliF [Firmicutes bacterium]|nr:flagellar M-ring protein FliF [Bacillota bacterium]